MPVLECSSDDQFLSASGDTSLLEVYAALPQGLFPPFPPAELPGGVAGLVTRGGFGQRFFFAAEVLGAVFRSPRGQLVHAGGRVVKNVQGYDLVRPLVGSFGALGEVLEVTFRLRPGQTSSFQVCQASLANVPASAQFAWQDGINTYAMQFGAPREIAALLEQFAGENIRTINYADRFVNGMGVQTASQETPELIDSRFVWVNGSGVPQMPAIFEKLARAL